MFIVYRFNINAESGAQQHSAQMFEDEIAAKKRFYSIIASDIDNASLSYEMAQVVRDDGIAILSQVFDNRPAPEPEPEPEVE